MAVAQHDLAREERPEIHAASPLPPRDLEFIESSLPWLERFAGYFRAEVHGFDVLPPKGEAFLVVGNHNGGHFTPDLPVLLSHWWRERGIDEPVYALFHSFFLAMPGVGPFMKRAGGVEASRDTAESILSNGGVVAVFPGGDVDVFRPWTQRNQVEFGGRMGFIRTALRTGVPVVPMVSVGAHETVIVLSRGDKLAHFLGLDRFFRVKVWPLLLGPPFGLAPAGLPTFPLPSKITVELMDPFDWSHYGPEGADDDELVRRLYKDVVSGMQETMDRLAGDRRFPVLG